MENYHKQQNCHPHICSNKFFFMTLLRSITPIDLIECKSLVPLITSQVYSFTISMSSNFTWKKTQVTSLCTLEYTLSGHLFNLDHNRATTYFAFCNSRPCMSKWACLMNYFNTTPAPSCGPFPWPKLRKFHKQM
jgi:hypothetical protein